MFNKVLIANRGEIAVRIIRACRELGLETVAVYSDVDRNALHVRYADEAYLLGPAPSKESYLRGDRVLEIAKISGTGAIHPGYGFLAERADFAQACLDAGLAFIGPKPSSIAAMGDKAVARATVARAGVPVIPGTEGEGSLSDEALVELAPQISIVNQSDCWWRRQGHARGALVGGNASIAPVGTPGSGGFIWGW
jgi:acetyl-CoA carboxylase biotin carboxylase subunit